jgi:hypothetical protein
MNRTDDARALKHRQVAFKAKEVNDDGTFKGYASVFGNVDSYGEIVMPGAFTESISRIKASGDPLPVLWQHQASQPIGGSDDLAEDDKGLATDGWLLKDDIPQASIAHVLMKRRVVKGLSIGYYVDESSVDEKTGIRSLIKLDLVEYSIVTFPANTLAQVDAVKSICRDGQLPSLKDFEDFLRESGFSKSQATAIASRGLGQLLKRSDSAGETGSAIEVFDALSSFKLTL